MEKKVVIVSFVVSVIGLLSVILAFVAEGKRIKYVAPINSKCRYDGSPALGLGLASALFLLVNQILISSFSGCICCKKTKHSNLRFCIGVTCYVISWVTFALAFILLFSAAILNSSHTTVVINSNECFIVNRGVFAGCAVLCLVTLVLGTVYYLISSKASSSGSPASNWGIAMGQPQMNGPPVFVHGDTYQRQQFP